MANQQMGVCSMSIVILFTHTISHKMVQCAMNSICGNTKIVRSHTSSMNSLRDILEEHAGAIA
ncbi:MAG: DUF2325 domain-containing protein [Lachnospiraceae bacterium]|nr:DUF2325 domain-containing protein [Lachnospiraceae bacterium]